MYTRYLKQLGTGKIYPYSDDLAQRQDMAPCDFDPREAPGALRDEEHPTRKEVMLQKQIEQRQGELYEARQRLDREERQARAELDQLKAQQPQLLLSFALGNATQAEVIEARTRMAALADLLVETATIEALIKREDTLCTNHMVSRLKPLKKYRQLYEATQERLQEEGFNLTWAANLRSYAEHLDEQQDCEAFLKELETAKAS